MKIISCHTLDSTSKEIKRRLAQTNQNEKLLILADEQTDGYGTHERSWSSPEGNIYMSFNFQYESPELLPYIVSYTLYTTVRSYISSKYDVYIKRPNDIKVEKKKIAGILIEEYFNDYIIGIGINLINSPIQGSTAIAEYTEPSQLPSIMNFIKFFFINLNKYCDVINYKGFLYFKRLWKQSVKIG